MRMRVPCVGSTYSLRVHPAVTPQQSLPGVPPSLPHTATVSLFPIAAAKPGSWPRQPSHRRCGCPVFVASRSTVDTGAQVAAASPGPASRRPALSTALPTPRPALLLSPSDSCSVRSGLLSALGNVLAQRIEKRKKKNFSQKLDLSGPLRYAVYGCFFTGPLSHYFYLHLERWVPAEAPWAALRRLLLDRLLFAPAFLLLFFVVMSLLEGKDAGACVAHVRRSFWPALRMNWRVWTPAQFVNINYVPLQFRVLFANLVALFWYTYLASLGK